MSANASSGMAWTFGGNTECIGHLFRKQGFKFAFSWMRLLGKESEQILVSPDFPAANENNGT